MSLSFQNFIRRVKILTDKESYNGMEDLVGDLILESRIKVDVDDRDGERATVDFDCVLDVNCTEEEFATPEAEKYIKNNMLLLHGVLPELVDKLADNEEIQEYVDMNFFKPGVFDIYWFLEVLPDDVNKKLAVNIRFDYMLYGDSKEKIKQKDEFDYFN